MKKSFKYCPLFIYASALMVLLEFLWIQPNVSAEETNKPKAEKIQLEASKAADLTLSASDFDRAFMCEGGTKSENDDRSGKLLGRVQAAYSEVKGLSAQFFQRSKLLGMGDSLISRGTLLFQRPGKMNWEYKEPSPQHFITDGKQVWYYEPRVNQLTIGELSATFSSDIPVSFLLGIGKLDESFDLLRACKNSRGLLLELNPRGEDKNLKGFSLLVSAESFLPIGARLVDVGDTSTEFIFTDLEKNPVLNKEQFEFDPPKGVDIVRQNNQG